MGIDARIVLKVKGTKPTDDWLTRTSFDLCTSLGASKFFVSDGLPQAEYAAANEAWHAAFNAHALYAEYAANRDDRSIGDRIRSDLGPCPKERRRAIDLTSGDEDGREPGKVYMQDGDDVVAAPGEWLLEISLRTRYYGVGYERGDLLTLCAVAEWCEHNINGCRVFYGGDSSGVCIKPFDATRREALRAHLYGKAGREYFQYDRRGSFPTPKPCSLCIPGEPRFDRNGWGNSYVAVNCSGCGGAWVSRDEGATWNIEKKES